MVQFVLFLVSQREIYHRGDAVGVYYARHAKENILLDSVEAL